MPDGQSNWSDHSCLHDGSRGSVSERQRRLFGNVGITLRRTVSRFFGVTHGNKLHRPRRNTDPIRARLPDLLGQRVGDDWTGRGISGQRFGEVALITHGDGALQPAPLRPEPGSVNPAYNIGRITNSAWRQHSLPQSWSGQY